MRRYINLFVPHRTWPCILFSTDLICYLLIQKTSIYLESLENNSNKNGDDDDNNDDNNDTNKTVQLVKSTIQPTKRESRRAAHVLAEKTMWKKYNKNNFLAPDESRIPRDSDEVIHERIKEQLNTLKPRTQQRGWECCVPVQSQHENNGARDLNGLLQNSFYLRVRKQNSSDDEAVSIKRSRNSTYPLENVHTVQ